MFYRAKRNLIIGDNDIEIAVVIPINCSKKATYTMAAFAAQQMNHEKREKYLNAVRKKG